MTKTIIFVATLAASFNASADTSADTWQTCSENVESYLWTNGLCGASSCMDDAGRSLEEAIVHECGYPEWTAAEREKLVKEAGQMCGLAEGGGLACPRYISCSLALFKKSDPIYRQILDAVFSANR